MSFALSKCWKFRFIFRDREANNIYDCYENSNPVEREFGTRSMNLPPNSIIDHNWNTDTFVVILLFVSVVPRIFFPYDRFWMRGKKIARLLTPQHNRIHVHNCARTHGTLGLHNKTGQICRFDKWYSHMRTIYYHAGRCDKVDTKRRRKRTTSSSGSDFAWNRRMRTKRFIFVLNTCEFSSFLWVFDR